MPSTHKGGGVYVDGSGAVLVGDCPLADDFTEFSEMTRTTTEVPGFFDAGSGDDRVRPDAAPVAY